jgi:hypothetical protein
MSSTEKIVMAFIVEGGDEVKRRKVFVYMIQEECSWSYFYLNSPFKDKMAICFHDSFKGAKAPTYKEIEELVKSKGKVFDRKNLKAEYFCGEHDVGDFATIQI